VCKSIIQGKTQQQHHNQFIESYCQVMSKRKPTPGWISRSKKKTVGQISDDLTADLDPIQKQAVDAALLGKNLFLTGVAGTGKSLVTQRIVAAFKQAGKEVAVAAPTGVAAVNLNLDAQTVHSLAGIRVPSRARDFASMLGRVQTKRWRKIEVVVIDEIGMLTADFLDWLDVHVRRIRVST
jgi:ATP-dependent exoDNAse (exonuclease V) alpha subunit